MKCSGRYVLWVPIVAVPVVLSLLLAGGAPVRAEESAGVAPIHVAIDAAGVVHATRADKAGQAVSLARVELKTAEAKAQAEALRRLGKALAGATEDPKLRGADGSSRVRLVIEAADDARWQWIQWVMQVGASPKVQIWQLELRRSKAAEGRRIELPRDRGVVPGQVEEYVKLKLDLFRKNAGIANEAFTRVRVNREKQDTVDFPRGAHADYEVAYKEAVQRVEGIVRSKQKDIPEGEDVRVEIVAPPPSGGAVPFRDVLTLVELVRSLGLEDLVFEGAAPPLMTPTGD